MNFLPNKITENMCGIFAYLLFKNEIKTRPSKNIKENSRLIFGRGPDVNKEWIFEEDEIYLNLDFYRLSIMDTSSNGDQPLKHPTKDIWIICNGEIYNHEKLKLENDFETSSNSDCEIILHMYEKYGIRKTVENLDGVFSFILYDKEKKRIFAARDPIGVRPLFFAINNQDKSMAFASEMKCLTNLFDTVDIFQPGHYLEMAIEDNTFSNIKSIEVLNNFSIKYQKFSYYQYYYPENYKKEADALIDIRNMFIDGVNKRLMSDRPVGCLLSGGLDSSLVSSIVSMSYEDKKNLHTFSIGLENSPDLDNAEIVSKYLGTTHHRVELKVEDFIAAIPEVIKTIETYDITTIRASVPNYLLAKYISENTDIIVILSGEGADEIFGGYLYFHYAPSEEEFQEETHRRVRLLHQFDVLRCDRTTATHGLEVRVPFLDKEFINYVLSLDPALKISNNKRMEKWILRKAFEGFLPEKILWRQKDAFSDAVGYTWVSKIKEISKNNISLERYENRKELYPHNTPDTEEAFYYREIFEEYYPNKSHLISEIWRPKWTDITEPSATALKVHNNKQT